MLGRREEDCGAAVSLAERVRTVVIGDIAIDFDVGGPNTAQFLSGERGPCREPEVVQFIRARFAPDGVFFDCGSNIGLYTLFVARSFPGAEVHAFDVHSELLKELAASLMLSPSHAPVSLVPAALGSRSGGLLEFARRKPAKSSTTTVREPSRLSPNTSSWRAVSLALDDYVSATGRQPTLIKLDVEGAEFEALLGMAATLRRGEVSLLLEVHPKLLAKDGLETRGILRWLATRLPGYRAAGSFRGSGHWQPFDLHSEAPAEGLHWIALWPG